MKHYIGLDISKKETAICMIDEKGKIIHETMTVTKPDAIATAIRNFGTYDIDLVGLESGSWSPWLSEELRARELPATTCDARKMAISLSYNPNKTDRNDARGIAECMRMKHFTKVADKSKAALALGALLKSRKQLVKLRTDLQQTIRGMLKPFGVMLECHRGQAFIEAVQKEMKALPPEVTTGITSMLKCFQGFLDETTFLDKKLLERANKMPTVQRLMTAPGVGVVTALSFVSEIGDPTRFRDSKTVGAYFGLTPRQYSSGQVHRMGKISKHGSSMMRSLLYESGMVILTRVKAWSKLKAWGLKIERKHGRKKAAIAVGRRLAVILHTMTITGEKFRFTDKKAKKIAA